MQLTWLINQSINQSIQRPVNRSNHQINQSINQSFTHLFGTRIFLHRLHDGKAEFVDNFSSIQWKIIKDLLEQLHRLFMLTGIPQGIRQRKSQPHFCVEDVVIMLGQELLTQQNSIHLSRCGQYRRAGDDFFALRTRAGVVVALQFSDYFSDIDVSGFQQRAWRSIDWLIVSHQWRNHGLPVTLSTPLWRPGILSVKLRPCLSYSGIGLYFPAQMNVSEKGVHADACRRFICWLVSIREVSHMFTLQQRE